MKLRIWLIATALALLGGCSTMDAMKAQNPDTALKPVNAVPEGEGTRLMLKGHDVVSYWTKNTHALGLAQFSSLYEGVTFRFASAENKALFDAAPTKYLPQYGGFCADGINYGIPWGGDADTWMIKDGRLFIFGGASSKAAFLLDTNRNIELADRYWKDEIAGNNSFVQRSKRLVFRVPHYKSGSQLAAEVAAAKGK